MLKYSFNMTEAAEKIEKAVEKTLNDGFRTGDICGKDDEPISTEEMGAKIIENL